MILNDRATFPPTLINRAKFRFNQKISFPRDTKQLIHTIVTINGWNTQFVHTLRKERDGMFHFNVNTISRIPTPVELSNKWILANFRYQEPAFFLDNLMIRKNIF